MSANDLVTTESISDEIWLMSLCAPKGNTLSLAVIKQIIFRLQELPRNTARAVIIQGNTRAFCIGADIRELARPDIGTEVADALYSAFNLIEVMPYFCIAAISGYALGAGCELAMACDYRIASETSIFGQPEIVLGIMPGGGATQRLPRLVGPARAKELLLTGRKLDASEALRIGLADEIVESALVTDRAIELARDVASKRRLPSFQIKQAINYGLGAGYSDGLTNERTRFSDVLYDAGL